ncbi:hypothetical protein PCO86_11090 [Pectobacteriaceae bacterium CE70]|nr:hypothetical protein PCO87_11965 [Pectobacteriaceae bacterium C52]WJV68872.1 hypothetical protein PCO86_11090 [Pectobacteriaceae bacterium CE70]WJY12795.1 hypothetical protein PCO80_10935 [Pectobacteriaceae bacterium C80]
MSALMLAKRKRAIDQAYPQVMALPDCLGDFEADLHRERILIGATEVFGEYMSKKTSNTGDAKQKRES